MLSFTKQTLNDHTGSCSASCFTLIPQICKQPTLAPMVVGELPSLKGNPTQVHKGVGSLNQLFFTGARLTMSSWTCFTTKLIHSKSIVKWTHLQKKTWHGGSKAPVIFHWLKTSYTSKRNVGLEVNLFQIYDISVSYPFTDSTDPCVLFRNLRK